MTNCSDNNYYIKYTDPALGTIAIPKSALDQTTLDIILLGKTRLEYGEVFNENLLHLLENFASPNDETEETEIVPDLDRTFANLLEQPVIGQLWYNNSSNVLNVCVDNDPIVWKQISDYNKVSGNSGFLSHGEEIPLPVSDSGYTFSESECIWNVSPSYLSQTDEITDFTIEAPARIVNASYTTAAGTVYGFVNYIILGFRGISAIADINNVPCSTPPPTPTITVTPSVTPTITVTPTVTPSVGSTLTPTPTPAVTSTPSISVTPTRTPTVTPTRTPSATVTPTISVTPSPSISFIAPNWSGSASYSGGGEAGHAEILSISFRANGNLLVTGQGPGGGLTTNNTNMWLSSTSLSDASLYEVKASDITGDGFSTSAAAVNTYVPLTSHRIWIRNAAASFNGVREVTATFTIRKIGTISPLYTKEITLTATGGGTA